MKISTHFSYKNSNAFNRDMKPKGRKVRGRPPPNEDKDLPNIDRDHHRDHHLLVAEENHQVHLHKDGEEVLQIRLRADGKVPRGDALPILLRDEEEVLRVLPRAAEGVDLPLEDLLHHDDGCLPRRGGPLRDPRGLLIGRTRMRNARRSFWR